MNIMSICIAQAGMKNRLWAKNRLMNHRMKLSSMKWVIYSSARNFPENSVSGPCAISWCASAMSKGDFLAFIGDAPLVIHNAGFDHAFLCAELKRVERALIARERLVDTLMLARRKHPAGPNRLDDLCARYGIDNSRRTKHGALLDAEILAEVYLELIGARQAQLGLAEHVERHGQSGDGVVVRRERSVPLAVRLSEAERAAHRDFVATLGENAVWRSYLGEGA